jgi:sugar transferase (PEP-CTERM system associated)
MLVVVIAMLLASFVVFGGDAANVFVYQTDLMRLLLVVVVCSLCMQYYDLYDSMILVNPGKAATRVVQVLGSVCVILACVYYVYPVIRIDQNLLMIWVVLAGISLIAWRKLFLTFNRSERLTQKTLLLGAGPLARELASEIESRPQLGLRFSGYVGQDASEPELEHLSRLGGVDQLPALLERYQIERVIVAMENRRGRLPVEQLLEAKERGVIVDEGAALFEAIAGRVHLDSLRPTTLLFSEGFRVSPLRKLYKRTGSIVGSLIGMALTLPIMAIVAIAVRLESKGPVIFRQKRIGKDGKPFTLYKFRSMHQDADRHTGVKAAEQNDSRCTRVGRFLRRSHLDELPQLFNIFIGDMHFIGPRPFAAEMEADFVRQIPFYSKRWTLRPGATGWAQVRKGYNETFDDNVQKLAYDLYYIKNCSIGMDFLIVLETIKILLLGRGGR